MTHAQAIETAAAERYLLDEMSELERHAFENHYFSCLDCAEDVRTGGLMRDGVKAGLVEATKATASSHAWRPSIVLPWAVAASLALVVGYQTTGGPETRLEPHALAPITLRPASRGAETEIPLPDQAPAVTLALAVNAGPSVELIYELRTAGNENVASGRVAYPEPGAPLMLLVPVWTLRPAERYILSLRHASDGNLVDEYRFGIAAR